MYRLFFLLSIVLVSPGISAQNRFFNITRLDSTENYYAKIQSGIRTRSVGTFQDTLFSADHAIHQIISYRNFEAPHPEKAIWTIIDKYEFNNRNQIEKIEHWKTDNAGKICRCGNWQLRRNGIFVALRPYGRCSKKGFACDENGDALLSKKKKTGIQSGG